MDLDLLISAVMKLLKKLFLLKENRYTWIEWVHSLYLLFSCLWFILSLSNERPADIFRRVALRS